MVVGLIIIATIAIGVNVDIQTDLIQESGLLDASLIGWQILYILPISIVTNNFFLAQFWLRTFSSKTDKDLKIGVSVAAFAIFCIACLVGVTGLIAVWSALWPGDPPQLGSVAFFSLLEALPSWVVGIVLVMVVSLSTAAFDSIQSAMVSTASNDLFRNRLNIWLIRALVVLLIIPVVVLGLKAPSILQIYLISNLASCATIPILCLGLSERYFYWMRGFEVVAGGLGGLFTVFLFGTVYYGNPNDGIALLILQQGLYAGDWAAFGAFVAAPVGSILWGFIAAAFRLAFQFGVAKKQGRRFDALDRPVYLTPEEDEVVSQDAAGLKDSGKFF